MFRKPDIAKSKKTLIIYVVFVAVILAVYGQVHQFEFVNIDDNIYVTENYHIKSGITLESIRWALTTTYAEFWHPLTWLSLMADYELYGLHAGGYHVTNLILHILSTLLLFWLFHRMTGALWKSAFVAAFFALHPLHVESVAWVSERKDVLSAFFWMLTLCCYVVYTEKQSVKRYLLVVFSFVLALLSKPMVVTLPLIMILLDYWPLKRFESEKGNLFSWQLKEKLPLLALSAALIFITFYAPDRTEIKYLPLNTRLANAPIAFVAYLAKTFWPHNMAVFYPFPTYNITAWKILGAVILITTLSVCFIATVKRFPYLFVGWFWFAITVLPVIKIVSVGNDAMADRYHYLPSIGIAIMLAWGVAHFFKNANLKNNFIFSAGIIFTAVMAFLSWSQCGYWQNSFDLSNHALRVTKNNFVAHNNLASALVDKGQYKEAIYHYNKAIRLEPGYADAYYNRGIAYHKLGYYRQAVDNYNQAIQLVPNKSIYYTNRGAAYIMLIMYRKALADYDKSILINQNDGDAFNNRAFIYFNMRNIAAGCADAQKACELGTCDTLIWAKNNGYCYH